MSKLIRFLQNFVMCCISTRSNFKMSIADHTLWKVDINEVRCCSEHNLLQDDSEAVDISFLSSIDRSSCHT